MAMKEGRLEWTGFTEPSDDWAQFTDAVSEDQSVFEQCFPAKVCMSTPTASTLCVDHQMWSLLCCIAAVPDPNLPALSPRPSETCPVPLRLPSEQQPFDWVSEESLEVLPTLFKPAKPESPIDIQFDHSQAAIGLASLTLQELQAMDEEMRSKFSRLSRMLVDGLEERDALASELDTGNRFVSAILRVQSLRMSNCEETRKRTWSGKYSEDKTHGKYLSSVLPYHLPEGHKWSSQVLSSLTAILQAIAEDSDKVPLLVSEYIQDHIIDSPRKDCNWKLD